MENKTPMESYCNYVRKMFYGIDKNFSEETASDDTIRLFSKVNTPLKLIIMAYDSVVSSGEIESIESLDDKTKSNLWDSVKTACNGNVTKDKAVDLCKMIWLINSFG